MSKELLPSRSQVDKCTHKPVDDWNGEPVFVCKKCGNSYPTYVTGMCSVPDPITNKGERIVKQCKHCKWRDIDIKQQPCRGCIRFDGYVRKWWLFWCWWIPKVLLLFALLLGGCVHVRQGDFEYWRLGEQQIGEAILVLPDGSELLLDGQKSELPKVVITATSIEIGKVQP